MRLLWSVTKWALVVTFVSGCGAKHANWPAKMVALNNFDATNEQIVVDSLHRLNAKDEKPLLLVDGETSPDAFPVTIEMHAPWPNEPLTAGITYREEESCRIALSTELFKSVRQDYVDSVIWHEVGHCAGLSHDPKEGSVMYATARPFKLFKETALKEFFGELRNVLWSEPLGQ